MSSAPEFILSALEILVVEDSVPFAKLIIAKLQLGLEESAATRLR